MGQKILSYSTAIAISLLLLLPAGFTVHAQQRPYVNPTPKRDQKKNVKEEPKEIVPLYNGTYIGVDLYGIGSKLLGGDLLSSEINVAVNLKNMFLPTVDVGFGTTDSWSDTGIHYKSSAPFFRIGVDYNTMAKKKREQQFFICRTSLWFQPYEIRYQQSGNTRPGIRWRDGKSESGRRYLGG